MRARIDVSEIEAKTKIRAKYLRALENEEWGLLPGPTFVKSFLRTYAQALDLDGKALVEEYRLQHEHPSEAMLEPIVSTPQSRRGGTRSRSGAGGRSGQGGGPSRGYVLAVGAIGVVIVVLIALSVRRRLLQQERRHLDRHGHDERRRDGQACSQGGHAARPPRVERARRAVAESDRARLRVPDRRRRAQADPGRRAAARRKHAHVPRQALRAHARQQLGDDVRRRQPADGGALERSDRLLDHQGLRAPPADGGQLPTCT